MVVYINIGGDYIIKTDDIIGVFDIDKTTVYKTNRNYLSNVEKRGKIINITNKIPKSFIVCADATQNKVYISPLNTATLSKRLLRKSMDFNGGV